MLRMLIVLAALVILVLPISTSSEDATNLDTYLNHLTDKKVDIVFVFDTSNSMGGEINELRAIANKFAADLDASHIDYHLGLVEFRDFPITSGEGKKNQCGSPGDFAYVIKGNGTLTSEISTFSSWLEELQEGGGGSGGPEAILAALRHAGSDILWREDAEKEIILLTDAGPHPDGSCCNAEGDTLGGTIFGLMHLGARANIIGPDDESLKKIAKDTGGQFFEIRSGLSLKPLLEKITEAMSYSFNITADIICENGILKAKVQLVGKDTIPYLSGQTDVWMYLKQAGNRSRYNLSYDQALGAYGGEVPDSCGPVDLSIYGRVGESSAVQMIQADCESCEDEVDVPESASPNNPPVIAELLSDKTSPQDAGTVITWTANAFDPDGDQVLYKFFLDDEPVTDWITNETWTWTPNDAGSYRIEVRIRDGEHAGPNGLDSQKILNFMITEPKPAEPENQPPIITDFKPAQDISANITWTVIVEDPDADQIFSRYFLNNKSMTDWSMNNKWTLNAADANVGDNEVEVQVRDGKHAGIDGYDDVKSVQFKLSSKKAIVQTWMKRFVTSYWDSATSVQQTSDGGYIIAGKQLSTTSLIKTDSAGNKLWNRTLGRSYIWTNPTVQQTVDGGYIIASVNYTEPRIGSVSPEGDLCIVKTDSEGRIIWDKTFSGSAPYTSSIVQQNSDGGYIIASETESFSTGANDARLIKTDYEGNELWDRTFGGVDYESAESVQQTNDGGYIIAGRTESYGAGSDDVLLIKTDSSGNTLWDATFGGKDSDSAKSVQQTSDGGYIIAGWTESYGTGMDDAWLIKTDSLGNRLWDKTFGGPVRDLAESVRQTSDGGYIIAGSTFSFSEGENDAWLIKTDSEGNELWNQTFGGKGNDGSSSVQQTNDGGYIIAVDILSPGSYEVTNTKGGYGSGTAELWLIKTDPNGEL